jgi:hypothetical protein
MVLLDADPQTLLSRIFEQAFSDPKIKTTPLLKQSNTFIKMKNSRHQTENQNSEGKKKKNRTWDLISQYLDFESERLQRREQQNQRKKKVS